MADMTAQLLAELKVLRKGRGIHAYDLLARTGPALRAAAQITAGDPDPHIRTKLAEMLEESAKALPHDLALSARVALAMHSEAGETRLLQERIRWLAERMRRDIRTAQRRMDDALHGLALVMVQRRPLAADVEYETDPAWSTVESQTVLRLDESQPVAFERRRIVARRDGIDVITVAFSVPRDLGEHSVETGLEVEVFNGGRLVTLSRASASRYDVVLELPITLRRGEQHEYGLMYRILHGQPIRPHYVFIPRNPCEYFSLTVRFDLADPPKSVWRVSGLFHRELDEAEPSGELLQLDKFGETGAEFHHLQPGFGYGIRWIWSTPQDGSPAG